MTPRRDLTTQLVIAMMTVVVVCIALLVGAFEIGYLVVYALGLPGIRSLK